MYNLKPNEYEMTLQKQNNKCAICGNELKTGKGTAVDHCHTTGKFRGILCAHCNLALGMVKENINTLQSMITYLENN